MWGDAEAGSLGFVPDSTLAPIFQFPNVTAIYTVLADVEGIWVLGRGVCVCVCVA